MEIKYATNFRRQYRSAPKHIQKTFDTTLELFVDDPGHTALNLHSLKDRYAGFESINVTGDWRALFKVEGERYVFYALGTHQQLYGND